MIKEVIDKIIHRNDLSEEEAESVMTEIMEGKALSTQISSFLTSMRMKGETVSEITGCAKVMRRMVTHIKTKHKFLVDTCGTGGDKSNTFNISTISAFVAAGAGVIVAKHGNRSVSSKCGSADLLEELGVNIEAPVTIVERCLDEVGIGFMYAPLLHSAMKYAVGPRREIGIRTIFNILGPLTNPAGAQGQVLGVYSKDLVRPMAQVLRNLGCEEAWVVHGADGLDEITTTGDTYACRCKNGMLEDILINPKDFGIAFAKKELLMGGDKSQNAKIAKSILCGTKSTERDIVVFNAAIAIVCGQKAVNIKEGIKLAGESIDSGMALQKLEHLIKISRERTA
jgi:anthranilate phosphoribosyltransferase